MPAPSKTAFPQSDAFKQAVEHSKKLVTKPSQDELLEVCLEGGFFFHWLMVDHDEGEFVWWICRNSNKKKYDMDG